MDVKDRPKIRTELIAKIDAAIDEALGEADKFGELTRELSTIKNNIGMHVLREIAAAWPMPHQPPAIMKPPRRHTWT